MSSSGGGGSKNCLYILYHYSITFILRLKSRAEHDATEVDQPEDTYDTSSHCRIHGNTNAEPAPFTIATTYSLPAALQRTDYTYKIEERTHRLGDRVRSTAFLPGTPDPAFSDIFRSGDSSPKQPSLTYSPCNSTSPLQDL
ncbi:hypothetical protein TSAR_002036 [Trichomalopsis sarcophagae]|uniref:Uncharacterized protein n=1 Tax=Trichomalopsis sarcophagae TaxID=543379 RepID=A0A232F6B5_9HYME|nr:hypothetical protein TSAR_002036 [Trichomalopsis sarcophagae]